MRAATLCGFPLSVLIVTLSASACSQRAAAPKGGDGLSSPIPSSTAQSAQPATATVNAPAPATSASASASQTSAAPVPAPVPSGPTPGQVYCGARACDARTEFCFAAEGRPGVCKPRAELERFHAGSGAQDRVLECDDASDCPSGQRCCMGAYFGGTGPASQLCDATACLAYEACVPGAACSAGNACKTEPATPAWGRCAPANLAVACGKSRCSGDTPACCWDSDKKTGACVPDADHGGFDKCEAPAKTLLACRNKADCGGQYCCLHPMQGSSCWGACGGSADTVLCDTFADCPKEEIMGPEGPVKFTRCNKSGGLGYCQ